MPSPKCDLQLGNGCRTYWASAAHLVVGITKKACPLSSEMFHHERAHRRNNTRECPSEKAASRDALAALAAGNENVVEIFLLSTRLFHLIRATLLIE